MSRNYDLDGDELSSMTLLLSVRLKRKLREFAIRDSISVSELARTALKNHLEKYGDSQRNTRAR
jgi:hypothetical protein